MEGWGLLRTGRLTFTCKTVVTMFFPRVYNTYHLVMPSGKHYQKCYNIKLLPLITLNLCLHFHAAFTKIISKMKHFNSILSAEHCYGRTVKLLS